MNKRSVAIVWLLVSLSYGTLFESMFGELLLLSQENTTLGRIERILQVHEILGMPPLAPSFERPARVFDAEEAHLLCELMLQTKEMSAEEVRAMPVEIFRARRRGELMLFSTDMLDLECGKSTFDFFAWTLPTLVHFWSTDFIFLVPDSYKVWIPVFGRSVRTPLFPLEPYNSTLTSAWVMGVVPDFLASTIVRKNDWVEDPGIGFARGKVDENPLITVFDNWLFRGSFQLVLPFIYVYVAGRSISVLLLRQRHVAYSSDRRVSVVLLLNLVCMFSIAVFLWIEGYCSRGVMSSNVQNSHRTLFFGTSCAQDFLVAAVWHDVIKSSSVVRVPRFQSTLLNREIPLLLSFFDVTIIIGFMKSSIPWTILYKIFPGTLTVAQLFIMGINLSSTKAVIRVIQRIDPGGNVRSSAARKQHAILRRLVQNIRVSTFASAIFLFCLAILSVQGFYLRIPVYVPVNALLLLSNALRNLARVEFCRPLNSAESKTVYTVHPGKDLVQAKPGSQDERSNISRACSIQSSHDLQ